MPRHFSTDDIDSGQESSTWKVRSSSIANAEGLYVERRLNMEREAQRRLREASGKAMKMRYVRELSTSSMIRFIRRITIDMSYTFDHWHSHHHWARHLKLWVGLNENVFHAASSRRLVFPDLALIGVTSLVLCYYKVYAWLWVPVEAFTVTSMALGLLVTFKTQTGYNRYKLGRQLWANLISESRATTSRILTRVPTAAGHDSLEVRMAQKRAIKLVRTFALTMKYHLTQDGCNPHVKMYRKDEPEVDVDADIIWALRAELEQIWNPRVDEERAFVRRLLNEEVVNRPLYVIHELGYINGAVFCHPQHGGLDGPAATEMDRSITSFSNTLATCERILRTPIYTPYTKFTSRFLHLWCNALPMALFPLVGPVGTPPLTVAIAFLLFGIEDIGMRVEQPFDILPLWQYCEAVDESCEQILMQNGLLSGRSLLEDEESEEDLGDDFSDLPMFAARRGRDQRGLIRSIDCP